MTDVPNMGSSGLSGAPPNPLYTLIDSHCHLDFPVFDPDRGAVLARARLSGILTIICPATVAHGWPAIEKLTTTGTTRHPCPGIRAAYGLHPMFLDRHCESHLDDLADWLEAHPDTVAIGECGLDGRDTYGPLSAQQPYLDGQIELARRYRLPLILHAHKAVEQVYLTIRRLQHHSGVVHSFNGSLEQARRLIDAGYHLGFGGPITYAGSRRLRTLVQQLPLDALLLETDSPDQIVSTSTGRNEPSNLRSVFNTVCQLREESPPVIAEAVSENARRLFGIAALNTDSDR